MCPTNVTAPLDGLAVLAGAPPDVDWVVGQDGQRLHARWLCPQHPRAIVWYVLGPEAGAAVPYPRLTQALLDNGLAVTLMHPRGTGFSPGRRGDVEDFQAFLSDYASFRNEIERRCQALPVFLLGHSAGAAFAAHVAATTGLPIAGLVLVNAAYRFRHAPGLTPTWRQYVAYAANLLIRPSAPVVDMNSRPVDVGFEPDREEALVMQRDPVVVRRFSMRMLLAQKRVMDHLPGNVAALAAPVLILEGAHDALVDPVGNDLLLARATAVGSAKLVAPDGGHGSSAVDTAVEPLVRWLTERLAPRTLAGGACHGAMREHDERGLTMAINLRRVLTAGLVAGLTISLSAIAMVPVVGDHMDAALEARGVPPLSTAAMAFFVAQSFLTGVLLVWLYAAVQPRLRPGPKTAAIVAGFVWLVGGCMANVSNVAYGFMPVGLTVVGTMWSLVELQLASQVGAYLYRDA